MFCVCVFLALFSRFYDLPSKLAQGSLCYLNIVCYWLLIYDNINENKILKTSLYLFIYEMDNIYEWYIVVSIKPYFIKKLC